MGVTPAAALGAVRLSLGRGTTTTDISASACASILTAANTLAAARRVMDLIEPAFTTR